MTIIDSKEGIVKFKSPHKKGMEHFPIKKIGSQQGEVLTWSLPLLKIRV
jgi:hypothetical protein